MTGKTPTLWRLLPGPSAKTVICIEPMRSPWYAIIISKTQPLIVHLTNFMARTLARTTFQTHTSGLIVHKNFMFPECSSCFPCARNGRVIYRVCNAPDNPHYHQCVKPLMCLACNSPSRTKPAPKIQKAKPKREVVKSVKPPNLMRRAVSYAEAVVEWTAAGRPERSDEEVQQIFNQFCKPCNWFQARHNICRGCGCRVAKNGFAIFNKIKMATQHCPRRRW